MAFTGSKPNMAKAKTPRNKRPSSLTSNSNSNSNISSSNESSSSSYLSSYISDISNKRFLSQLASLRSFVGTSSSGDDGSTTGTGSTGVFTESDLSTCLRQCGYNVQLAAEQLLTGQFKTTSSSNSSNSSNSSSTNGINTQSESHCSNGKTYTSSNSSSAKKVIPSKKSNFFNATTYKFSDINNTKSGTVSPKDNNDTSSSSSSKNNSCTPTLLPSSSKTKRKHLRDNNIESNHQKPPFKKQFLHQHVDLTKTDSVTTVSSSSITHEKKLLLCQRWIVGFSTSRKGEIGYHEHVHVYSTTNFHLNYSNNNCSSNSSSTSSNPTSTSASSYNTPKKQCNIIRFKGKNIEGTLDSNLSNILVPLLSYTTARPCTTYASNNNDENVETMIPLPLIEIHARGLMHDDTLRIGTEVPLEIEVYITQPSHFFALFDNIDDNPASRQNSSFQSKWFHNKNNNNNNSNINQLILIRNAAFDLLQWGQYGDVPMFESTLNDNNDDSDENNINGSDTTTNCSNNSASGDEKYDTNMDDMANESLVDEHNEDNVPSWAQNIFTTAGGEGQQHSSSKQGTQNLIIQEENDPLDLNAKGIFLRPYQRQALFWMLNRENNANTKMSKDLHEQLELLSDLASEASSQGVRIGGGYGKSQKRRTSESEYQNSKADDIVGIKCEVGPVLVSKDISSKSCTLDGIEDPVCHPLWRKRYLWDKDQYEQSGKNPGVYSFFVNELIQTASKTTPDPPRECCGGILADSMGLGKTVMLIALISKDKEITTMQKKVALDDSTIQKQQSDELHCTLIITPLSLLPQWEEEIASKSFLSCKTAYGDSSRKISDQSDLQGIDVLITTYGTIQCEFNNRSKKKVSSSSILSLKFRRVILDESHLIKNPTTNVSKACCSIIADRRWCVTGTPIINSLHDLFGLLRFLKHEPWCNSSFWKNAITRVMNDGQSDIDNKQDDDVSNGMKVALERVRRVLSPLLLRRTKDTLDNDGKQILTLPPIERKIVHVEFNEGERFFYNVLLNKSQAVFEGFIAAGTASKSWLAIFSLIQRLRQACDHLSLTVKNQIESEEKESPIVDATVKAEEIIQNKTHRTGISSQLNDEFFNDLLKTFQQHQADGENDMSKEQKTAAKNHSYKVALSLTQSIESRCNNLEDECCICLDNLKADDIAITPCSHLFCRRCLLDALNVKDHSVISTIKEKYRKCPMCMSNIDLSQIKFTTTESHSNTSKVKEKPSKSNETAINARQILEASLNGCCSSKITAILKELDLIWKLDPGSKVIIFSQFLGMLDLIGGEIKKMGVCCFKLDGKMSLKDRRSTLKEFSSTAKNDKTGLMHENIDNRGSVLLASMKACGVGINLVCASSVFIVDCWWNDAMEDQCVNRIHRIGQKAKTVRMRKFIVSDSVEEKIVKMQERKKQVASEVLSNQHDIGNSKGNPTLDDFKAIFGR